MKCRLEIISKIMTVVMLYHCPAHDESCSDTRSFEGLNKFFENISKYPC